MGIRIDGASDLINATDGSLTVDGLSINVTGIVTASSGFQVGSAATIHSTGQINSTNIVVSAGSSIGIGTDNPDTLLHVYKSGVHGGLHANSDAPLMVENNGNCVIDIASIHTGIGGVYFSDTGASGKGKIEYKHGDDYMTFQANGSERVRILSTGRVAIGTDSASSTLQIYAEDLGEGTAKGQIILKDTAAYNASPQAGIVFQIHHASNNAQAIVGGIRGLKANAADGDYDGCLAFDVRTHGAVAYEAMRINEAGQVGINTTVPGRQLEVYHDTQGTIAIKSGDAGQSSLWLTDTGDSNIGGIYYEHDVNKLGIRVNDSERFCINSTGDVNITGVTTATSFVPTESSLGNRRINVNGAMQIWQRSTSAADIGGSNGYFACDRYRSSNNGSGRHTISRDTDEPGGFDYSMKIDVTTAVASPSANNYMFIQHRLEGQDVQPFAKGTSRAQKYALSFWVKSPKTGVHVVQLEDVENSRSVQGIYTIASANTWENHSIIFPAETSNGISGDNAHRMQLYFWLFAGSTYNDGNVNTLGTTWGSTGSTSRASGQVNVFDNTSNNFYITGIQFEVGSHSTPFEHRRYDDEYTRCKRYFQDWTDRQFFANKTSDGTYDGHIVLGTFEINMRTNPTISPKLVYGRIAGGSSYIDGDNNEAAAVHHDPSGTFPGRFFLLTGTWNWHSGYNDTIAVKFHSVKMDAEL